MRRGSASWLRLRARLPPRVAEPLAVLCLELGAPGVVTGGRDLRRSSARSPAAEPFEAAFPPELDRGRIRSRLERALAALEREFPGGWRASVELAAYRPPDSAETWRRHFRPLRVGRRLMIAPSWEPVEPRGRQLLRIDPGQAFGTGHHPTTRGCLLEIEEICRERGPANGLDVGSGTGVLALAMTALGVGDVAAVDVDPAARAATAAAARANGARGIRVLSRLPPARLRFDLIAANLYSRLLVHLARRLSLRLSPRGVLVVSGLLVEQEGSVRAGLLAAGLRVTRRRCLSRWVTLAAEAAPPDRGVRAAATRSRDEPAGARSAGR